MSTATLARFPYELSEADLAHYREHGHWSSPRLFTDEQVAELRRAVTRTVGGERDTDSTFWLGQPGPIDPDNPAVVQVCNGWWVSNAIREASTSPVLAGIAAQLMQTDECRIWHDQALYKPGLKPGAEPNKNNNVGWHQDASHWQVADSINFVTAWIAFQDTDEHNGAMRIVKGSHAWGLYDDAYAFGEKDLDALEKKFTREGRVWAEEPVRLKAGEVSFHHSLLFHGSGPNLSPNTRISLVVHYMAKGVGYNKTGKPWHPNTVLLGPDARQGDPFAGPFFPRVWPAMR